MTELRFRNPEGHIHTTTREKIMKKAPNSLFARMIDPEQQMQVQDPETGDYILTYKSNCYTCIFDYFNEVFCTHPLIEYQHDISVEFYDDLVATCDYFMLPVPSSAWRAQNSLRKINLQIAANRGFYVKKLTEIACDMISEIMLDIQKWYEDETTESVVGTEIVDIPKIAFIFKWSLTKSIDENNGARYFSISVASPELKYLAEVRRDYPSETCHVDIQGLFDIMNDSEKIHQFSSDFQKDIQNKFGTNVLVAAKHYGCFYFTLQTGGK